ncbi:hypothetical protein [Weizmannia acidilactici]
MPADFGIDLPYGGTADVRCPFFGRSEKHIKPQNTAHHRLESLHTLQENMKKMELPKTREEFEARAALYVFLQEIEQYLTIKSGFNMYGTRSVKQTKENTING